MRRLRKFFALSAPQRWRLLKTLALLAAVRIGLWILPFRAVLRLIEIVRPESASPPNASLPASSAEVIWAVNAASRFVPQATCLTQAIAGHFLLNQLGYPAKLEIGVARNEEGPLEAHAWVEIDGETLIGRLPDLSRFTKFPTLHAKTQRS